MTLRMKIIQAATQSFNKDGAKFTLVDVTKLIGISKKTIYTQFENKEDLLMAMVIEGFRAIKIEEQIILDNQDLTTVDKIRKIIIVQPDKFNALNFSQLVTIKDKYPELYTEIRRRIESDWEPTIALIEQGIEEGCIRSISIPVFKAMVEASIRHFWESESIQSSSIGYQHALSEMMNILMTGIELKKGEEHES